MFNTEVSTLSSERESGAVPHATRRRVQEGSKRGAELMLKSEATTIAIQNSPISTWVVKFL